MFSRRGYNIESITVGASETPGISRMTIIAAGNRKMREQIIFQLRKLIDVIKVAPLEEDFKISRELMLIKLRCKPEQRQEIFAVLKPFHGSITDVGTDSLMVQVTGEAAKNEAVWRLLTPYGIISLSRTGEASMSRC